MAKPLIDRKFWCVAEGFRMCYSLLYETVLMREFIESFACLNRLDAG